MSESNTVEHYEPEVVQASDYYAFGLEMPGRKYNNPAFSGTNEYRYGFNGKELDKSGEFGSLTHYDYGFRIYNPSIGKFLSVDPLTKSYPWYTPYQFAGNKPIVAVDLDGLEEKWVTFYERNELFGGTSIDRQKTTIKIDKDAVIYNEVQERVAVTHVRVIDQEGNVKSEWDMHEQVDENGKMDNGFFPTAKYNLNDLDPNYTFNINEATKENGFQTGFFGSLGELLSDYSGVGDGSRLLFSDHLNSSPEKETELKDFDDAMIAIKALSGRSGNSDVSPLGVKRKPRTSTEHTKGARPSTEQKHEVNQARIAREQKAADERYSKTKSTKVPKTNNQKKRDNPDYKKPGPKNNGA